MAIPAEFDYSSEDDFNQRYLIPLLHRLGFSVVANYHGQSEFGKDLVFAEIDRFGHVRFHAVQSKYVSSIGLNAVEELVLDCKQAFANTFRHPQTGSVERISSFYGVNGGSISEQAVQQYFNSLVPIYGGNVRLLQSKDLIVLDRWATQTRSTERLNCLNGVLLEVRFNRRALARLIQELGKSVENNRKMVPLGSVKSDSVSAFLSSPVILEPSFLDLVEGYWGILSAVDDLTSFFRSRPGPVSKTQAEEYAGFVTLADKVNAIGTNIEKVILGVLSSLGDSQG